jgi:hypothetical protein
MAGWHDDAVHDEDRTASVTGAGSPQEQLAALVRERGEAQVVAYCKGTPIRQLFTPIRHLFAAIRHFPELPGTCCRAAGWPSPGDHVRAECASPG